MVDWKRFLVLIPFIYWVHLARRFVVDWPGARPGYQTHAIPIWKNPDVPLINRFFDYGLPLVLDLAAIVDCGEGVSPEVSACVDDFREQHEAGSLPPWEAAPYDHETLVVGARRVRVAALHHPARDARAPRDAVRVVVFLHGGGLTLGNAEDSHVLPVVARLAASLGDGEALSFYSVDYALAPERPYPHGPDDALDAYAAILERLAARGRTVAHGVETNLETRLARSKRGLFGSFVDR